MSDSESAVAGGGDMFASSVMAGKLREMEDHFNEKMAHMNLKHQETIADLSSSYVASKPLSKIAGKKDEEYTEGTHYEYDEDNPDSVTPIFANLDSALSDPVDVFGLLKTVTGTLLTPGATAVVRYPAEVVKGVCLNFRRAKALFKLKPKLRIPYLGDYIMVHQGKSNPKAHEFTLKRFSGWLGFLNLLNEKYHNDESPVTAFGAYIEIKGAVAKDVRMMKCGVTTGLAFTMDFVQHIVDDEVDLQKFSLTRVNEVLDMNSAPLVTKLKLIVNLFCAAIMIDVNSPLPDFPLMSTLLSRNIQDPTPYVKFMHVNFIKHVDKQLPFFCLGQKTGDKVVADFKIRFRDVMGKDVFGVVCKRDAGAPATKAVIKKERKIDW